MFLTIAAADLVDTIKTQGAHDRSEMVAVLGTPYEYHPVTETVLQAYMASQLRIITSSAF
jgi:hypothetical protein